MYEDASMFTSRLFKAILVSKARLHSGRIT